ncbi:MAG: site-2 protease family protein [Eubacteriales bacterium]|nr:site-2 protease family protein [Eubacteriales bacterium]
MDRRNLLKIMSLLIGGMILIRILDGQYMAYGGFMNWVLYNVEMLPGIVIGLSFHEFGHAWVSDRFGDPTPRRQGRISLNPLHHVDWIGFLCLLFAGFGWGKPVEIDPRYYKKPRRDEFLVSIAGVFMNLVTAVLFSILLRLLLMTSLSQMISEDTMQGYMALVLLRVVDYIIQINVVLMIFNLLPIPPLDGFGILTQIFDLRKKSWYMSFYRVGPILLVLLIMFGGLDFVLNPLTNGILSFLQRVIISPAMTAAV